MRNAFAMIGCLLLVAACQKAAAPAPKTTVAAAGAADCHLKVGWDPWEPYQYQDIDGSMRGMDVDIVQSLAKRAGCSVEFERGSWKELLNQVRDGKVDILMSATPTPARLAYATFSPAYRQESFVLLTRTGDAPGLAGRDLAAIVKAGKRIGITEGYYYGEDTTRLMEDEATRSSFVSAPVVELNYTRLLSGQIDALLDDPFVAASILRHKGLKDQVTRSGLEIANGDVSFMYSKASVPAAIVERLDQSLATHLADGTLARLKAKYQGDLVAAPSVPPGGGVPGAAASER